jgi:hypothetical protein
MGMAVWLLSRIKPRVKSAGTAATFDDARANFGGAWKIFFANRTDADFGAWREQRDSWKYAMWDSGRKLPTQVISGRSKCFCGADLTIGSVPDHVRSAHREMA